MTTVVQSVIKNFSNVTSNLPKKIALNICLMLTSLERKNTSSLSRSSDVSYDKIYIKRQEAFYFEQQAKDLLIRIIQEHATDDNPGYLISDFTMIPKPFSKQISEVTYDYSGVTKSACKGLSAGFIFWSNGSILIPFDFTFWLRKKDIGELYKKKSQLVQELVQQAKRDGITFTEILLDGAFASVEMIKFLENEKIDYTIRIPKNRVVETINHKAQLAKHPELKLYRNEKFKTIKASYKGHKAYFTVQKRKGRKKQKEVVFIISSVKRTAKEHVKRFEHRWPCEKCFRTSKQSVGLTNCQSTDPHKQRLHLYLVMISYTILELARIDKKKNSVEEVLRAIRYQKQGATLLESVDLEQTIMN